MQMTIGEIVRNYKQAKDKRAQIKILAELNTCDVEDIKQILRDNGMDLRSGSYRLKAGTNVPEQKTVPPMPKNTEPEPAADGNSERIKVPDTIRKILEEDLNTIEKQLGELVEKRIAIKEFLDA